MWVIRQVADSTEKHGGTDWFSMFIECTQTLQAVDFFTNCIHTTVCMLMSVNSPVKTIDDYVIMVHEYIAGGIALWER